MSDAPSSGLRYGPAGLSALLDGMFSPAARARYGEVVSVAERHVRMRLVPGDDDLRPGPVVSGPTLMGVADVAAFAVVAAHLGPVEMAVTTTLTMHFLRGATLAPLFADARLLKLGRRLATIDVRLWQDAEDRLVAQATVGFALP